MPPPLLNDHVLEHIVSFLISDRAALKACRQADRTLAYIAARYFFTDLYLHNRPDNRCVSTGVLDALGPRVHRVVIDLEYHSDRLEMARSVDNISTILSKLAYLKSITLRGELKWRSISRSFRTTFLKCLQLTSVKDVSIGLIKDFPVAAFTQSTSIKSLSLEGKFSFESWLPSSLLDSLTLHYRETLPIMPPPNKFNQLRSLELLPLGEIDSRAFDLLRLLVNECSATLKKLVFEFGIFAVAHKSSQFGTQMAYSPLIIPQVDFAFPKLEQLVIHARISESLYGGALTWDLLSQFSYKILPSIAHFVRPFRSLKHLSLKLFFKISSSEAPDFSGLNWMELDTLFVNNPALHVDLYVGADFEEDRIISAIEVNPSLKCRIEQRTLVINE